MKHSFLKIASLLLIFSGIASASVSQPGPYNALKVDTNGNLLLSSNPTIGQFFSANGFLTNGAIGITNNSTNITLGLNSNSTVPVLAQKTPASMHIFEGDSITAGTTTTNPAIQSYPYYFSQLSFASNAIIRNVAVAGSFISTNYATTNALDIAGRYSNNVYPLRPASHGGSGGAVVYLDLMIGINNVFGADTNLITEINTYTTKAKSDGFTVVLATILDSSHLMGTNTTSIHQQINNAIRAGVVARDIIWDANTVLTDPYDTNEFSTDGIHPLAIGNMALAQNLNSTLSAGGQFIGSPATKNIDIITGGVGSFQGNITSQGSLSVFGGPNGPYANGLTIGVDSAGFIGGSNAFVQADGFGDLYANGISNGVLYLNFVGSGQTIFGSGTATIPTISSTTVNGGTIKAGSSSFPVILTTSGGPVTGGVTLQNDGSGNGYLEAQASANTLHISSIRNAPVLFGSGTVTIPTISATSETVGSITGGVGSFQGNITSQGSLSVFGGPNGSYANGLTIGVDSAGFIGGSNAFVQADGFGDLYANGISNGVLYLNFVGSGQTIFGSGTATIPTISSTTVNGGTIKAGSSSFPVILTTSGGPVTGGVTLQNDGSGNGYLEAQASANTLHISSIRNAPVLFGSGTVTIPTISATSETVGSITIGGATPVIIGSSGGPISGGVTLQNDTFGNGYLEVTATENTLYLSVLRPASVTFGAGTVTVPTLTGTTATHSTILVNSGANKLAGTVTLVAGQGTVTSTAITTNTVIFASLRTAGGTQTFPPLITVGTGTATFSANALDAGTYNWIGIQKN